MNVADWFRQKYREFQEAIEAIGIKPMQKQEMGKNRGLKM
jgi:hypothetical protein